MADLLRLNSIPGGGAMQKDKLGSPSTGSEDGGNGAVGGGAVGLDVPAESTQDLAEPDEFDGPALPNGRFFRFGIWEHAVCEYSAEKHERIHARNLCVFFLRSLHASQFVGCIFSRGTHRHTCENCISCLKCCRVPPIRVKWRRGVSKLYAHSFACLASACW